MEGRLALWLPQECAPASRGRHCQEDWRVQRERDRDGVHLWQQSRVLGTRKWSLDVHDKFKSDDNCMPPHNGGT